VGGEDQGKEAEEACVEFASVGITSLTSIGFQRKRKPGKGGGGGREAKRLYFRTFMFVSGLGEGLGKGRENRSSLGMGQFRKGRKGRGEKVLPPKEARKGKHLSRAKTEK